MVPKVVVEASPSTSMTKTGCLGFQAMSIMECHKGVCTFFFVAHGHHPVLPLIQTQTSPATLCTSAQMEIPSKVPLGNCWWLYNIHSSISEHEKKVAQKNKFLPKFLVGQILERIRDLFRAENVNSISRIKRSRLEEAGGDDFTMSISRCLTVSPYPNLEDHAA